jgi:hypothetical protein
MDLRRLVNVAYADLTRDITADGRKRLDAELGEPFEHELSEREQKRLAYRRKAREIGADVGQEQLMGAFKMPTTGGARG